jgi:hypothetical protein
MMEALSSSETSVRTTVTRRHIPEDGILRCHGRENLKSYISLTDWALQQRRDVSPVSGACSRNVEEEERVEITGRKTGMEETTRKTNIQLGG